MKNLQNLNENELTKKDINFKNVDNKIKHKSQNVIREYKKTKVFSKYKINLKLNFIKKNIE